MTTPTTQARVEGTLDPLLAPCPFCGHPAEHESTVTQETIRCTLCPATMSYDGSGAAVKAMWNGRANNAVRGAAEPRTLDGLVGGTNREDKR